MRAKKNQKKMVAYDQIINENAEDGLTPTHIECHPCSSQARISLHMWPPQHQQPS